MMCSVKGFDVFASGESLPFLCPCSSGTKGKGPGQQEERTRAGGHAALQASVVPWA